MKLEEEIGQSRFKSCRHKLAVNLHFTASWYHRVIAEWLAPYELSLQQYNVLRILRGQYPKPSRVTLVQERMIDRMSNVSRLIEKLRRKELVERQACCNDRRAVDLVITDKGLTLLKQMDEVEKQWLDTFHTLSPEEVQALNQLLDKLRG
jgi:DNA-binding MarR family transcriptional regulator